MSYNIHHYYYVNKFILYLLIKMYDILKKHNKTLLNILT